jgi:hypothetical protein
MAEKAESLFDRETLLDLTVNFIPLGILLLFLVIFAIFTPFGFDSVISSIQFAIIGVMFVALAVLTYYSGAAVSRAEKEEEAAAALDEGEGETDPELDASGEPADTESDDGADDGTTPELDGEDADAGAAGDGSDDGDGAEPAGQDAPAERGS